MPIKYSYNLYRGNADYYKTYDKELQILEERAKAYDKRFFSQILLGCNKVTASNGETYNFKAIQFSADADPNKKISDYCADFIETFNNLVVPEKTREAIVNFVNVMSEHTLEPEELSNIQLNSTKTKTDEELEEFYKSEGFALPTNDKERELEEEKLNEIRDEENKNFKITQAQEAYNGNVSKRELMLENVKTIEELADSINIAYKLSPAEQNCYNYFLQKSEESERISQEELAEYENEREAYRQSKIAKNEEIKQRIIQNNTDLTDAQLQYRTATIDDEFDDELDEIDENTELGKNAIRENNMAQNLTSLRYVKGLEIAEFMYSDNAVAQKAADFIKDTQTQYKQMSAAGRFFSYLNPFSNPYRDMRNKLKDMKNIAVNRLGLNIKDINDYANGKTEAYPDKNPSINYKTISKAIMQARINEANGIKYPDEKEVDAELYPDKKPEKAPVERIEDRSFKIPADDVDIQYDPTQQEELDKQKQHDIENAYRMANGLPTFEEEAENDLLRRYEEHKFELAKEDMRRELIESGEYSEDDEIVIDDADVDYAIENEAEERFENTKEQMLQEKIAILKENGTYSEEKKIEIDDEEVSKRIRNEDLKAAREYEKSLSEENKNLEENEIGLN